MGDSSSSSYSLDRLKSLVRFAINASRIAATFSNKERHMSQTFNFKNKCVDKILSYISYLFEKKSVKSSQDII